MKTTSIRIESNNTPRVTKLVKAGRYVSTTFLASLLVVFLAGVGRGAIRYTAGGSTYEGATCYSSTYYGGGHEGGTYRGGDHTGDGTYEGGPFQGGIHGGVTYQRGGIYGGGIYENGVYEGGVYTNGATYEKGIYEGVTYQGGAYGGGQGRTTYGGGATDYTYGGGTNYTYGGEGYYRTGTSTGGGDCGGSVTTGPVGNSTRGDGGGSSTGDGGTGGGASGGGLGGGNLGGPNSEGYYVTYGSGVCSTVAPPFHLGGDNGAHSENQPHPASLAALTTACPERHRGSTNQGDMLARSIALRKSGGGIVPNKEDRDDSHTFSRRRTLSSGEGLGSWRAPSCAICRWRDNGEAFNRTVTGGRHTRY